MTQRRLESSAPNRLVIADASGGTLAVPTFASRMGVVGALDQLTGAPVIRPQDEMHLDHRTVRVHDMEQRTPAGVPDRRVSWQHVNDYDAEYEDGEPAQSPYGQSSVFTAKNRSTRHVDGSKEALPGSLQRIVGSEDGRYALALTLNEVGLEAPEAKQGKTAPDGSPVADLPIPEGVAFREPSKGAQGLASLRGVVVGGLFVQGQAATDAARSAINAGGNAGDVARWALAASRGQPPPPIEGRNLPTTEERPAEEPAEPEAPEQIARANKPAGYVRGPNKTGTLGTFFTTEASKLIHVGRDAEQIGTLPARHDYQIALDSDRRATLGINDADCAGLSEGSGEEVKGWLQPDTSQAGADTSLPGKDSALRPVIKIPKPDAITIPPPLPPREGAQCQPPAKPGDPPEPESTPDAGPAIAEAEKAEAAATAAANAAKEKADAAALAAATAKADPNAKAGQGGPEERNAAGAAANAAREARAARRAAEAAHEALEQAKSRGEAAKRATDAAKASGTGASNAIMRTHQRRAVEAANRAARAAAQAAARAQRSADRAAKANVRANRAALQQALKAKARADREARQARSERIKAEKAARENPDSAAAKQKAAEAREAEAAADKAAIDATNNEQQARNKLEDAKKDEPKKETPVPPAEEEKQDEKEAEEDKEEELVGSAIGRCAVAEAEKADDDAPFIVIGGHPDGSKWIGVHEGDNSLLFQKIGPGGDTKLGAVRIGSDGTITTISETGTETEVTGGGLTSPVAVADGGTGATTAAGARTNLGVAGGAGYLMGQPRFDDGAGAQTDYGRFGYMDITYQAGGTDTDIIPSGAPGAAISGGEGAYALMSNIPTTAVITSDPILIAQFDWRCPEPLPPNFSDVGTLGLKIRFLISNLTGDGATIKITVQVRDPSDHSSVQTLWDDSGVADTAPNGPYNATNYTTNQAWFTFTVSQADLTGLWAAGDTPAFQISVWEVVAGGAGPLGTFDLGIGSIQLDLTG